MNIARNRLFSQRISGGGFTRAEDVVKWMGAMQAQDYGQALWAIGVRMQAGTIQDVLQAIAAGKILRTWPMRGTMHFVPAEDARWMLQLSAARMVAGDARRLKQLELDEAIIEHCKQLFTDALSGGKRLSRPAMMALLEQAGIATTGGRGYYILWHAAQSGLICVGPMEGKQQTFALLDEWAPGARMLSREEALAELAGRYFASRGPATVQDFAWWSGLPMSDAKTGLEAAKVKLTSEIIDGKEYWLSSSSPALVDEATGTVLLPGFDEYLLGYKDRSAVLAAEHAAKVIPGGNGVFQPIIVVGGQVVGAWKRTIKKTKVEVALTPFAERDQAGPQLQEAISRYQQWAHPL